MNTVIVFIQNNKDWIIPLVLLITAIITGITKLFGKKKSCRNQNAGNISNSTVTMINGDVKRNASEDSNIPKKN